MASLKPASCRLERENEQPEEPGSKQGEGSLAQLDRGRAGVARHRQEDVSKDGGKKYDIETP
jgi:hypothetical protein